MFDKKDLALSDIHQPICCLVCGRSHISQLYSISYYTYQLSASKSILQRSVEIYYIYCNFEVKLLFFTLLLNPQPRASLARTRKRVYLFHHRTFLLSSIRNSNFKRYEASPLVSSAKVVYQPSSDLDTRKRAAGQQRK